MLCNTGTTPRPSANGLLTTLGYQVTLAGSSEALPAVYALEGGVAIAGALIQWLRDNLGIISDASEVGALATSVDDNGGCFHRFGVICRQRSQYDFRLLDDL